MGTIIGVRDMLCYLVVLLETHFVSHLGPNDIVLLDIDWKVEILQDVHCFIAFCAFCYDY